MLRVATISHDLVTDLKGGGYVVTRTSHPIERTQLAHVLLEYGWQNTRLNPDLIGFNNYSYDFVSQATDSVRIRVFYLTRPPRVKFVKLVN